DTGDGAEEATADQEVAHQHIDIAAPPVANGAGDRGGNDLTCPGADRHGGGNAQEDQERGHDEAAAYAEHAGQEADRQADAGQQKHVERQFGDGKIDLHACPIVQAAARARQPMSLLAMSLLAMSLLAMSLLAMSLLAMRLLAMRLLASVSWQ